MMLRTATTLVALGWCAYGDIRMNYQSDAHGTYVASVCPGNLTAAPCQLNAHVIAMVSPEDILDDVEVGGAIQFDGSGVWTPMAVDFEYMMWNASSPRVTTGRASRQFKGMLQAYDYGRPAHFCAKMWARDAASGDRAELAATCGAVAVEAPAKPQVAKLEAHVNHYALTYACTPHGCVLDGHMIISTYATDPTHAVYGGGAVSMDGGATFETRGLRSINQAKPSHSNVLPILGPRIQVSFERRLDGPGDIPAKVCFTLWAADAVTHEVVDVLDNDAGEPLPAPVKPGLFCYAPYEIVV